MLELLVLLLVYGLVYWVGHMIITGFGLPAPVGMVLDILLVVSFIVQVAGILGLGLSTWSFR